MFLYLCTCMCEGVECFELDSAGNHSPLQPFQNLHESINDQQLVKDVTDAFQSKVSFKISPLIDPHSRVAAGTAK